MYTQSEFINDCLELFRKAGDNYTDVPGVGNIKMYEEPLIGFAAASDEIFETYRQKKIIGENFMEPAEWLPSAKTVVSFFLPFTDAVRNSNKADKTDPSAEWLYARIEGQAFIGAFMESVRRMLVEKGVEACVPSGDKRFGIDVKMTLSGVKPDFHVESKWSERHAAYACGLGTFGLSRGLITEKGMAGRFASVIISEEWDATKRPYINYDEYCTKCGACIRKCPVNAITLEYGKNNVTCNEHVEKMKTKYSPRYGCGKCQVGVPCEKQKPIKI